MQCTFVDYNQWDTPGLFLGIIYNLVTFGSAHGVVVYYPKIPHKKGWNTANSDLVETTIKHVVELGLPSESHSMWYVAPVAANIYGP